MDKCPYCSAETRQGDNFCLNCGNRLVPSTPSPQQAQPVIGDATLPASKDWVPPTPEAAPSAQEGEWSAKNQITIASTSLEPAASPVDTSFSSSPTAPVAQALQDKVEHPAHLILRTDTGDVLQEYPLEKPETSIGRAPTSDILLSKDKLTSRRHATVRYENGNYVIVDERSANGTFVNGQQLVEMTPRTLQDGDHIGIGEHELVFQAYKSASPDVDIESMPTTTVSPSAMADITYRTREDELLTASSADDFSTRSMDGGDSSSSSDVVPEPVTPSTSNDVAPVSVAKVEEHVEPVVPAASDTSSGVTFSRLTNLTQPTLPDAGSQDTTKELSLFAIACTALEDDDRAFIRTVYSVEAGISQSKPEGFEGEPFKLPLRSNIRFLFLEILLQTSSNIELISYWHRRLRYDSHNPEPQLVAFKFKVVAAGSCSLALDFYYERRWLKNIRFAFEAVEQSRLTAIASEG